MDHARCRRCCSRTRASTSGSGFPSRAKSRISTGRVEIGQGVLTAMRQIAAEELDVDPERIVLADRRHRADPERGLYGGQPVDPVRRRRAAAGLRRGAGAVSRPRRGRVRVRSAPDLAVRDGAILYRGDADRAGLLVARRRGRSRAAMRPAARAIKTGGRIHGRRAERGRASISPAKVFGEAAFVHDMTLDGMVHARVVRQPRRGATIASIDEAAIRRAAKGSRSRSSATAISSRSSAPTRPSSKPSRRWRRRMSPGTVSSRSARFRRRRAGCCSSPRSTARSARRLPIRRPARRGARRLLPGCTSVACLDRAVLRHRRVSRRQAARSGRIRRASIRCARRWRGP